MIFPHRIAPMRLHLLRAALMSLAGALVWTPMMIYQAQVVGLTPLQMVLIGTTMEISIFLFEIPTGVVADVVSRRLSCIIGFCMMGVSYLVQLIPSFEVLLLAQLVWGIGFTFTSGAYDAWMVDEIGVERSGAAFLSANRVGSLAGIAGVIGAGALGSLDLRLPMLIGGLLTVIVGGLLLLFMPETGFTPTPRQDRSTFGKLFDTLREGVRIVRGRPALLRILGVGLFLGLFSEGWDRLWQVQLLQTYGVANAPISPVAIIAALNIGMMALGALTAWVVERRLDTNQPERLTRALLILIGLMVVGLLVFGLSPSLGLGLAGFAAFTLARGLQEPLFSTWTNQHIDSGVRATVLSMQSQTDAIGQIVGGLPSGAVGQLSLRLVFVSSALLLSPALWLLRRRAAQSLDEA
jgi:DHA3 family tetracycline resistance protein-like MFS transporter